MKFTKMHGLGNDFFIEQSFIYKLFDSIPEVRMFGIREMLISDHRFMKVRHIVQILYSYKTSPPNTHIAVLESAGEGSKTAGFYFFLGLDINGY